MINNTINKPTKLRLRHALWQFDKTLTNHKPPVSESKTTPFCVNMIRAVWSSLSVRCADSGLLPPFLPLLCYLILGLLPWCLAAVLLILISILTGMICNIITGISIPPTWNSSFSYCDICVLAISSCRFPQISHRV